MDATQRKRQNTSDLLDPRIVKRTPPFRDAPDIFATIAYISLRIEF